MGPIGPTEIIIVLVIVILLFGVGRIGKIGGELGKSIREFRKGIQGDEDKAGAGAVKKDEQKPAA
jgi:sec-independent protein translocase protein TatA